MPRARLLTRVAPSGSTGGPTPGVLAKGEKWRGHAFRPNTGKWANRGGANKGWYNGFYAAKKQGEQAAKAYLEANPHPKKRG